MGVESLDNVVGNGRVVGSGGGRKSYGRLPKWSRREMMSPRSRVVMVNMERVTQILWIAITQLRDVGDANLGGGSEGGGEGYNEIAF